MAEIATIARPYAEALFKTSANDTAQQHTLRGQLDSLAALAGNDDMLSLADNPKVSSMQVFDVIGGIAMGQGVTFDKKIVNLLRTVVENGRLAALPEISTQYQALVNRSSG
ncbi:MAG: F0F1 ATP synthase subunit delta, partial [Rubrivivax sp.]